MTMAETELVVLGAAVGISPLLSLEIPYREVTERGEVREGSKPQGVAVVLLG